MNNNFEGPSNIVPLEAARAERHHREASQEDPFAADEELAQSLIGAMKNNEVYDLLVVERAQKAIEDFIAYIEVFTIYKAIEEVEQYQKMLDQLSEALRIYERRNEQ